MNAATPVHGQTAAPPQVQPPKTPPGRPRRTGAIAAALSAVVVALFLAKTTLGDVMVPLPALAAILRGEVVPGLGFIVMEDRLPAAAVGLLAGAAYGLAGTLFQTLLRNPLASPDVIGVGYGGATAAVAGMLLFDLQGVGLAAVAFGGALAVALAIHALSDSGRHTGSRLILVGIGFAAMLQAVITYLMTRTDVRAASEALHWLVGSLSASTWERAGMLGAAVALLLPGCARAASTLRILELGDDAAAGLGLHVRRSRLGLVVLGVALCAAATAVR